MRSNEEVESTWRGPGLAQPIHVVCTRYKSVDRADKREYKDDFEIPL